MSIQIRLDAGALNALFPEGSQARVDLQACVIAEFTKKLFRQYMPDEAVKTIEAEAKKLGEELTRGISLARQDITRRAEEECGLARYSTRSGSWGSKQTTVDLTPETVKQIKQQAESAFGTQVDKHATDVINERIAKLTAPGSQYDRYIERTLSEALNKSVLQKVQAALG